MKRASARICEHYYRTRRAVESVLAKSGIAAEPKLVRDLTGAACINAAITFRGEPDRSGGQYRRGRLRARSAREKHAILRARERYGVLLSPAELAEMVHRIESGDCEMVPSGRARVLIRARGKSMVLIYSKIKREIVTFLPPEEHTR